MSGKSMYWVLGTILILAGWAHADLVHHWTLDEDTAAGATTVADSVGGKDGTIQGAVTVPGVYGNAFYFDGSTTIEVAGFSTDHIKTMTLAFWMNPDEGYVVTAGWKRIISANDGWEAILNDGTGLIGNNLYRTGGTYAASTAPPPEGEWTHVAMTADLAPPGSGRQQIYVNGVLDAEMDDQAVNDWGGGTFLMGFRASGGGEHFEGMLDDVRIYDTVLTEAEVTEAMLASAGAELASEPNPADGAPDMARDVALSWTPGEFAATHDIYLGESFDDVNDASRGNPLDVLLAQGQSDAAYDVGRLEYGTTYYWRVDEVNAAPDNTIFKGLVWSFTVEPLAYSITNVTATASHFEAGSEPQRTADGSGIDDQDQHSIDAPDMWLASPGGEPVWIQYEFDGVYKLHEMLVWNYNVAFELVLGFGLKDVTVEYSTDGAAWTTLGEVQFAQASATATYTPNTIVDMQGVAARFVRLNVTSGWGPMGQFGLSEIRFSSIPVQAREPQPAFGATNVDPGALLAWRAGREAGAHEVHLSADEGAVAAGDALVDTVTASSYDLGALDLELDTTYYWMINEVNDAEAITSWASVVWSFSTKAFLVVEDFESYDDEENRIYQTWVDGYDIAGNGSQVGNLESPFAEQTIVNGPRQSMPLFYDNSGGVSSEAERTFDSPQDWTRSGAALLAIHFQGAADNAGRLYAKINGVKVLYDGDAADIAAAAWNRWEIDLASVGTNLASVRTLTIGIEGGGSGVVYVDDIQLLPPRRSIVTAGKVASIETTGDDGMVLSIDGIDVSNLILGTTTADFEKHAEHPAADADDFDLSTYASLDDAGYVQIIFAAPVTTIFIVERGANDLGRLQPLDAEGNPIGGVGTFAKSDWHKPGVTVGGQGAGAIAIEADEPIYGLTILPAVDGVTGIDPASVCGVPAE